MIYGLIANEAFNPFFLLNNGKSNNGNQWVLLGALLEAISAQKGLNRDCICEGIIIISISKFGSNLRYFCYQIMIGVDLHSGRYQRFVLFFVFVYVYQFGLLVYLHYNGNIDLTLKTAGVTGLGLNQLTMT